MGETIQLLTTADVRKLLKIGNKTCLELFHREDFPCQKFGRAYKITEENLKEYLKTREQFGKPLYRNQYLAFKMAELEMEIEAAKLMLYKAATDKQEGRPYSLPAAKAKYLCTEAAMHVTTEAVQMLGGNGYMKEYHVERMMRDAKITQIYEGTNEIQKLIVSGAIFR